VPPPSPQWQMPIPWPPPTAHARRAGAPGAASTSGERPPPPIGPSLLSRVAPAPFANNRRPRGVRHSPPPFSPCLFSHRSSAHHMRRTGAATDARKRSRSEAQSI
jgi:hypothetical protein